MNPTPAEEEEESESEAEVKNSPAIDVDAQTGNSSDEELWGFFEKMDSGKKATVLAAADAAATVAVPVTADEVLLQVSVQIY